MCELDHESLETIQCVVLFLYHDKLWIWPILAFQAWHVQCPFLRSATISGMGSGNIFCLRRNPTYFSSSKYWPGKVSHSSNFLIFLPERFVSYFRIQSLDCSLQPQGGQVFELLLTRKSKKVEEWAVVGWLCRNVGESAKTPALGISEDLGSA